VGSIKTLICMLVLVCTGAAAAHEVTIATDAAQAVLEAINNPSLTEAEARRIAQLPANKMAQRKVQTFDPAGTEDRFVVELLAEAKGTKPEGKDLFRFERARRARAGTLNVLAAIKKNPVDFARWVNDRVEAFSPPGPPLKLEGHLIAAGGPTGFAFGGNDFYLNITHFPDDLLAAKAVTAHELYHAVQGAAFKSQGKVLRSFKEAEWKALPSKPDKDAYIVDRFLGNLVTEGIAMYVSDPELLTASSGAYSKWDLTRLRRQQNNLSGLVTMLDLALIGLTSDQPINYRKAYAMGFLSEDQPLYFLGYEMAKSIERKKGPKRLGELLTGTGCGFFRDFIEASAGDDKAPKLGEHTLRMVSTHCPA
jgi:hypothetical protein